MLWRPFVSRYSLIQYGRLLHDRKDRSSDNGIESRSEETVRAFSTTMLDVVCESVAVVGLSTNCRHAVLRYLVGASSSTHRSIKRQQLIVRILLLLEAMLRSLETIVCSTQALDGIVLLMTYLFRQWRRCFAHCGCWLCACCRCNPACSAACGPDREEGNSPGSARKDLLES